MRAKMTQPGERAHYRLRRQAVEPVFVIVKERGLFVFQGIIPAKKWTFTNEKCDGFRTQVLQHCWFSNRPNAMGNVTQRHRKNKATKAVPL